MGKKRADTLYFRWSKREDDFLVSYPDSKATGGLICAAFCIDRWNHRGEPERSLVAELEARGYDTKTLRFTVRKRAPEPAANGEG